MKNILIACMMLGAASFTPAFADTAGPTRAEIRAALQAEMTPVTDTELRSYARAEQELESVYPVAITSTAQREQARTRSEQILMRHRMSATRYNEITTAIDVDAGVARRYAAISQAQRPGV